MSTSLSATNGLPDDDALWAAFRYMQGELSAAEAAAFEARLAEEQELRECVARAVELSAAIYAIESQAAATARPSLIAADRNAAANSRAARQKASWFIATTAAVCAAFLVGLGLSRWAGSAARPAGEGLATSRPDAASQQQPPPSDDHVSGYPGFAGRLVSIWVHSWISGGADEPSWFEADGEPHLGSFDMPAVAETDETFDDSVEEFQVPDWMLAAVASQPPKSPDDLDDEVLEN